MTDWLAEFARRGIDVVVWQRGLVRGRTALRKHRLLAGATPAQARRDMATAATKAEHRLQTGATTPMRGDGGTGAHVIHGAWDPLLRRVELYGVTDDLGDEALVRTFFHEVGHAIDKSGARGETAEVDADAFADAELLLLSAGEVADLAARLRALVDQPPTE